MALVWMSEYQFIQIFNSPMIIFEGKCFKKKKKSNHIAVCHMTLQEPADTLKRSGHTSI